MAPIPSPTSGRIPLPELNNHHHQQHQQIQSAGGAQSHFHSGAEHDDFFDQMLSALPAAWSDLGNPKSPWDLGGAPATESAHKLFNMALADKPPEDNDALEYPPYDESSLLASRLRQHQISGGEKPMGLQLNHPTQQHQQQMLFHGIGRSPGGAADAGLIPLPLSLGSDDVMDRSRDEGGEGMYNGFSGQLHRVAATASQQHFHNPQSYGGAVPPPAAAAAGAAAAPRQRVRARRGQATDPHSIAERLRRERIAERMKALQELVPNANKVLSMSRLGGAGAVAPLVADISSEAGRGNAAAGSDSLAVTEHQVAKLMEEDMGTAMQYLQGKGLCLMPISLASAISTAGCTPRNPGGAAAALSGLLGAANSGLMLAPPVAGGDAPTSPSMSVLTVQSAIANGGDTNSSVKEVGSVSKP